MILCVTLNPCLDKTLVVSAWQPGDIVRGQAVREVVGGKGNNVARVLKTLGHTAVRPVTFLGPSVGRHCAERLRQDDRLEAIGIPTQSETRVILTVRTGGTPQQTAFFDPDPVIDEHEARQLADAVGHLLASGQVRALTLSGSSPHPNTHGLFSELIALAQARGVPTFLDTYGPPLADLWGFWPTVIQLNRAEAAAHLGRASATDEEIQALLARWARRGVACAAVTDGASAVRAVVGGKGYRVHPPRIEVVNPIGSGDTMLAATVDGWLRKREPADLLRWAVAASAANVQHWEAGRVDPSEIEQLASRVRVEAVPIA